MQLREAIAAAGMTPPETFRLGRFVRFPGCGKSRGNSAGWCKLLTPTLAVFGDWSTGLSEVWKDAAHLDDAESRRLERAARAEAKRRAQEDVRRAREVERQALKLLGAAKHDVHPYLERKGFPHAMGLVHEGKLLVPIRAVEDYDRILSMQMISGDGMKRFLPGGRVKGGIHRLGVQRPHRVALCEGFATGLSILAAMRLLPGAPAVIVCFSAGNLATVAANFPSAFVCADHDESRTGEETARATGLKWVMPPERGDFNDMHQRRGLIHVVEALRLVT